MIRKILDASKSDSRLDKLLTEARECSQVYVHAKQTYRGFEGMGELSTMKEEIRDVVDKMIQYSKENKYISEVISYDIDAIADEIVKGQ